MDLTELASCCCQLINWERVPATTLPPEVLLGMMLARTQDHWPNLGHPAVQHLTPYGKSLVVLGWGAYRQAVALTAIRAADTPLREAIRLTTTTYLMVEQVLLAKGVVDPPEELR
jgi:hypothetical protein